jgi:hypothetical protein
LPDMAPVYPMVACVPWGKEAQLSKHPGREGNSRQAFPGPDVS